MAKLSDLKEQATQLGIKIPNNATIAQLEKLINDDQKQKSAIADDTLIEKEKIKQVRKAKKKAKKTKKTKRKCELEQKLKDKWKESAFDSEEDFAEAARKAAEKLSRNPDIEAHIPRTDSEKAVIARHKAIRKKRVIVTCSDPSRTQKAGEMIRARNSLSGPTGQMVLFDEQPQYLPEIIINSLKEIKYQRFTKVKQPGGDWVVKTSQENAFRITYLEDLTKEELTELARKQELAGVFAEAS